MSWIVAAVTVAPALAAHAQSEASPPAAPPAAVVAPAPAPAVVAPGNRGLILPVEKSGDLQTHWSARREYLRDRDDRRADDEEQRVRQLKDDLDLENLFAVSSALVRESHDALAAGAPALAASRCKLAVDFAPALPEAHTCLARTLLAAPDGGLKAAASEWIAAARAALSDPRTSRALLANVLGTIFLGVFVAFAVFALLLFARYAQLYAHDVHHLFPAGARRWQTRMMAAVLVLLPLFLRMGPATLLLTVLLACALYANTVEAAVGAAILCALAAAPLAAQAIARLGSYGGPAVDVWLLEHGEGSPPQIQRLQRRLQAQSDSSDLPIAFALGRKAKRDGDLATAEALYKRALEAPGATSPGLAATHNNLGNVYLLEGDGAKAAAQYQQAIDLSEGLAAAHFNLSRALNTGGVDSLEKVQSEQARALELDRPGVEAFTGPNLQANKKANKFVMDVGLDDAALAPLIALQEQTAAPVVDELRAELSGALPEGTGVLLPLLAAAGVVALHFLRGRLRPSGRCDRCGREVCRRCDPDARPTEELCAQCVNVFIRRAGVDAAERIRKEYAVAAYHRRRQLLARVLGFFSGAGHVALGYPLRGIVYLVVMASLVASIVIWRGLAHDPIAVRSGISPLRAGLTIAAVIAVYAVSLRDLLARQRAEGA